MNNKLLIGIALFGIGLAVAIVFRDHGQWVEVDGQRFWVRLTEYDPPVQIGMQAPPLSWRHRRLLGDVHKGMNWTQLSLADAKALAAKEDVAGIEQKIKQWREQLAANPSVVQWNQMTVEHAVEVRLNGSPNHYLLVCGQDGLHDRRSDWPQGVPCSVYIWDERHWRSCGADPIRDVILQSIPHTKSSELRLFLSRR